MSIPTQMSLHGFIATVPQLNFSDNGVARFYARIGVEQYRRETDGGVTKLDPAYHDLVVFHAAAERAYARFRVGDQFVAAGYVHEYERERNGRTEVREEFVARQIGHDATRVRFAFDRHAQAPTTPDRDGPTPARQEPAARGL